MLILRSCPWLIAYSMTGLSSMMAFTAPVLRLLFIKSPVSKVLIVKPYLSLILSRKRCAAVPFLTPTVLPLSSSYLVILLDLVVAMTTFVS